MLSHYFLSHFSARNAFKRFEKRFYSVKVKVFFFKTMGAVGFSSKLLKKKEGKKSLKYTVHGYIQAIYI